MKISILGATSQIAKDLILSFARHTDDCCILFSRSRSKVSAWLNSVNLKDTYESYEYVDFGSENYDAIINFIGVGDPARAKAMGASIFEITHQYDQKALDYIQKNPRCKYIFVSSGAVYGDVFDKPVDEHSCVKFPINDLNPSHWYGMAKLYAEARHRALPELAIVDVRVFNYFSRTQDITARFLITDILRAIRDNTVLKTSSDFIVRDYMHPSDFYRLVCALLSAPATNAVVDCYSRAPIEKPKLLLAMKEKFGLKYEITEGATGVNATGSKPYYYSLNTSAADFSYHPALTSLEGVVRESETLLNEICV